MVWNALWPDGTKSVRQNTTPGQENTTYTKATLNNDHYWDFGTQEDGHHRKVSMPVSASDPTIPTGMDGVFYLKEANSRIAGFYRNASGIYQAVPGFITGSFAVTTTMQNIVALPDNCYGEVYLFIVTSAQAMAQGYFKCSGGVCQAYCNSQTIGNSNSLSRPMKFGNGDQVSGLNFRAKIDEGTVGTYQYRIRFWAS